MFVLDHNAGEVGHSCSDVRHGNNVSAAGFNESREIPPACTVRSNPTVSFSPTWLARDSPPRQTRGARRSQKNGAVSMQEERGLGRRQKEGRRKREKKKTRRLQSSLERGTTSLPVPQSSRYLRPLSDLNVPPYFGLEPIRSMISGIQLANTAQRDSRTVREREKEKERERQGRERDSNRSSSIRPQLPITATYSGTARAQDSNIHSSCVPVLLSTALPMRQLGQKGSIQEAPRQLCWCVCAYVEVYSANCLGRHLPP